MTSWGYLRNAIYDTSTPYTWKGHTQVQFAADDSGLFVLYAGYSDFAFYPETSGYVINKLDPNDFQVLRTWKVALNRYLQFWYLFLGLKFCFFV